jgi:superoxide dismutase
MVSFGSIEFLINQLKKTDSSLNGSVFLWFLETRNPVLKKNSLVGAL